MTRTPQQESTVPVLDELLAIGDGAPSIERRVEIARGLRASLPDGGRQLDVALFERLVRMSEGLEIAEATQEELREILEQLDAPPWYPALFLRAVATDTGPRAMVLHAGARRVVGVTDGVDLDALAAGEEVFLGANQNVVAGRSPVGPPQVGETAFFERATDDGRCVLRWRDDEVVVDVAGTLDARALKSGDQIRWDRSAWMAFEKIQAAAGRRYLLTEVPDVSRDQIGGQDANLDILLSALTAVLVAPEKARRYRLGGRRSILLVGPPGCGKTSIARIAAAETAHMSGVRCRFGVVKPAEWESPWVGETQSQIRACFRALREESDGNAVLFLDEIESIGRLRGGVANQHGDKFLAALLAELDGFTDREGIAIIAATNRADLVDPALLERLSDIQITVRRPDMRGARAIFDIHLPGAVPIDPAHTREEIVETAVSRLYGPNADNAVCTLRFRDGKARTVVARELVSGRMFAQICRAACQAAFVRELRSGEPGVRVTDMEQAVSDAIERLASTLGRQNVHAYLSDLPQDVDVVSVEPVVRKVARPHRYRHAA